MLASVVAIPVVCYLTMVCTPPPPSPPLDQERSSDGDKVVAKLAAICRSRTFSPTAVIGIGRRGDVVAHLVSGFLRVTYYQYEDGFACRQYTKGYMRGPPGTHQRLLVIHHASVSSVEMQTAFNKIKEWGGDIVECVGFD